MQLRVKFRSQNSAQITLDAKNVFHKTNAIGIEVRNNVPNPRFVVDRTFLPVPVEPRQIVEAVTQKLAGLNRVIPHPHKTHQK
jgi:hypothetical protein